MLGYQTANSSPFSYRCSASSYPSACGGASYFHHPCRRPSPSPKPCVFRHLGEVPCSERETHRGVVTFEVMRPCRGVASERRRASCGSAATIASPRAPKASRNTEKVALQVADLLLFCFVHIFSIFFIFSFCLQQYGIMRQQYGKKRGSPRLSAI